MYPRLRETPKPEKRGCIPGSEKLPNLKIGDMAKVGGKFAALWVLDSNVDTLMNSLKEGLLSTADEETEDKDSAFGHKNEVLDLCNQRWQLKQQKCISTEAGLE